MKADSEYRCSTGRPSAFLMTAAASIQDDQLTIKIPRRTRRDSTSLLRTLRTPSYPCSQLPNFRAPHERRADTPKQHKKKPTRTPLLNELIAMWPRRRGASRRGAQTGRSGWSGWMRLPICPTCCKCQSFYKDNESSSLTIAASSSSILAAACCTAASKSTSPAMRAASLATSAW